MKDCYKYPNGKRWYYKRGWYNPRVSAASSCWKDQRGKGRHKRNTQYRAA